MEKEDNQLVYKLTQKDNIIAQSLYELFSCKFEGEINNNDYGVGNGTLKIPSAKKFAESGFQRQDMIILIDIFKTLLDVQHNGNYYQKFGDIVNHFVRNGSIYALTGEYEKKKNVYLIFTTLLKLVIEMDIKDRLCFLERLQDIHNDDKNGIYKRKESGNRIDVMYNEAQIISNTSRLHTNNIKE